MSLLLVPKGVDHPDTHAGERGRGMEKGREQGEGEKKRENKSKKERGIKIRRKREGGENSREIMREVSEKEKKEDRREGERDRESWTDMACGTCDPATSHFPKWLQVHLRLS